MIERVSTAVALGILAAGVAWGGHHYRDHLVEFSMIRAEYLYDKCVRECLTVCEANRVPTHECDCSHCEKYLEGK